MSRAVTLSLIAVAFMVYALIMAMGLGLIGCGGDDTQPPTSMDMAQAPNTGDMAVPPPPDMAQGPDLLPPRCPPMEPGFYTEFAYGTWTGGGTPTPQQLAWNTSVIIRNDGSMTKIYPGGPFAAGQFSCDVPKAIDGNDCTAPCCEQVQGTNVPPPSLYYSTKGWRLITSGACQRADPSTGQKFNYSISNDQALPQ